jgi:GTP-binding protein
MGSNRTGFTGSDLELAVPIGTLVHERTDDPDHPWRLCADLARPGQRVLVARGGRGGRGNARFASSTNRAPRRTEPGGPGEEKVLRLEMKMLADVGLVGFPNAGKSTLISRISAARPKIADYPFTTLTPNLGVVRLSGDRSFAVADVPGLIEGAHRGLGLGHQFLRHLERTKVLVHLVDVSSATGRNPVTDLDTVRHELELFQPTLAAKPQIVTANKMDAVDDESRVRMLEQRASDLGLPFFRISGASGEGLPPLLEAMWQHLAAAAPLQERPVEEEVVPLNDPRARARAPQGGLRGHTGERGRRGHRGRGGQAEGATAPGQISGQEGAGKDGAAAATASRRPGSRER